MATQRIEITLTGTLNDASVSNSAKSLQGMMVVLFLKRRKVISAVRRRFRRKGALFADKGRVSY